MGKGPEQTFFQTRHTNDQKVHEKVLNISNYQGNANQNHNEISPHTCQNGHYQKDKRGFPGGAVVENLPANAGDTGSSPGLGRSHMPRSNQAREPQLLSPPTTMKSGPHSPQLEKALAQEREPNTAKNNKINKSIKKKKDKR